MVEKFNGTFLEDMMYPTMPQIPAAAMRGGNPSQQFGYPATQMQQGAGAAVPQNPVYGSQPVYMAKGGPVGAGPQQQIGQGSGKGQQGQSGKGQQAPGQQAPMQMPGESMNAAMEAFSQQQDMQRGQMGGGYQNATPQQRIMGFFSDAGQKPQQGQMGQGLAALRGYEGFMGQQGGPGMGPQPIDYPPGQMPQQSRQDMRADFDRFRQGNADRTAGFRQAMQNPNLSPDQKRQMIADFRSGTEQNKAVSQDMLQRMRQARGQQAPMGMPQQMPQAQQMDMMRTAQAMEQARMQGIPVQQALPAGLQALANFRPQY